MAELKVLILLDGSFPGGQEKYVVGYAGRMKDKFPICVGTFGAGPVAGGFGEYMAKNRPCSVVESPPLIGLDRDGRQQTSNTIRQSGIAGRGIPHLVEFFGKPTKIVNGSRRRHGSNGRAGRVPVS